MNGEGGRVRRIVGEDYLRDNPRIMEYQFGFNVGDVLRKATSDSDRAGFYIACCETREELDRVVEDVSRRVYFEYEEGL